MGHAFFQERVLKVRRFRDSVLKQGVTIWGGHVFFFLFRVWGLGFTLFNQGPWGPGYTLFKHTLFMRVQLFGTRVQGILVQRTVSGISRLGFDALG